jgi:uncharacterized membrane protein
MALSDSAQTLGWVAPTLASVSLFLHIGGGALGLASGYTAVAVRKGETLHRIAGTVFVAAMLTMVGFALGLAISRGQTVNTFAGLFTLYMVLTAWLTVKRPEGVIGRIEPLLAALAAPMAIAGLLIGFQGGLDTVGVPNLAAGLFGALTALGFLCDLKVIRQGGVAGAARLSRHLWRMCAALLVATVSFFLGQMDEIPRALRGPHLWVLALAPLALLIFWMVRVRLGRKPGPIDA